MVIANYDSDGKLVLVYNIPYEPGGLLKGLMSIEEDNKLKGLMLEDDGSDEYWHDDNRPSTTFTERGS